MYKLGYLIQELRCRSYDKRLKGCDLTTIETSRLRGDQIEAACIYLTTFTNISERKVTLVKPIAYLSTCHLCVLFLMAILLNLLHIFNNNDGDIFIVVVDVVVVVIVGGGGSDDDDVT